MEPLAGDFLLCLFLRRLRFSASYPTAGSPLGVPRPFCLLLLVLFPRWGSVCGVLSLALPTAPAVLRSSTYHRFPFGVFCFCLPDCSSGGVVWAAAFSMVFSVLLLCRLACHCLVFCTLCWGSALEVFSSLCMAFWWFLMAPCAFRA